MTRLRLHILSFVAILVGVSFGVGGSGASTPAETESACASCHRERSQTQPLTPMGRATALTGSNPVLEQHPKLTVRKGPYTYTVETQEKKSTYSVTNGK